MCEQMSFEKTWEEFLLNYSFKDKKKIYTNGSDLIPVFRVEQMVEHYFVNERRADRITVGIDVEDNGSIDAVIEKLEKVNELLEKINNKIDVRALLTSMMFMPGGIDIRTGGRGR